MAIAPGVTLANAAGTVSFGYGQVSQTVTVYVIGGSVPLSAGVTIYVAASDLMPEVNREPGVRMALVVFLGVGLLFLLDKFVHVH